jgi:hypothetical protein
MRFDGSSESLIVPKIATASYPQNPRWRPDGARLVFLFRNANDSVRRIRTVSETGGLAITVTHNLIEAGPPTYSGDGTEIYFSNSDGIFRVPSASGTISLVAAASSPGWGYNPQVNPALSKIFFTDTIANAIKTVNLDGSGEQTVFVNPNEPILNDFSPDGQRVLVSSSGVLTSFNAVTGTAEVFHAAGWGGTWSQTPQIITPPGSPVTIDSGRISVSFGSVAARGDATGSGGSTTVELVRPEAVGDLPPGYAFSQFAYRIETDASYTGPVTFCIDVPADRYLTAQQFAALRILHLEGGVLVDRTDIPTDFANRHACGTANTVGQFVLAELIDPAMPSIIGQVVDSNGDPIVDHVVQLEGDESRFVQTDQQGQFAFRNLAAGADYSVAPNANGFVFDFASKNFPAIAGENIAVFTGSAQTFTISGAIRDGNGAPVQNVRVFLTGSAYREAVTDANGEYVFDLVSANESVDVRLDRSSIPSLTTLVPSPESYTIDRVGSDLPGLDFVLLAPTAATVSVGGRVTAANGAGLKGVTVTISGGSLAEPRSVRTNQLGRYSFEGIEAGQTYVITVGPSRRYRFDSPSRTVAVADEVTDADFIGSEP